MNLFFKSLLILILLPCLNSFAQDLIQLPEATDTGETAKKENLLVLPETEEIKEKPESKEIDSQPAKEDEQKPIQIKPQKIEKKDTPKASPQKPEQPKEDVVSSEKIMVLKAQKPLPKFYNILSRYNYKDSILKVLDTLTLADAKIVAFDTTYGYILFDTEQNRYLITIFKFNGRHWIKILPFKAEIEQDKTLNKFMSYID